MSSPYIEFSNADPRSALLCVYQRAKLGQLYILYNYNISLAM